MPDLTLAFALCLFVQQSQPSFLPTECHLIAEKFIQSGGVLDAQTKDKARVTSYIDGIMAQLGQR